MHEGGTSPRERFDGEQKRRNPTVGEVLFVLACGCAVIVAATVQIFWVLGVPWDHLGPPIYIVPMLVGCTFGSLMVVIRRLRDRERAFSAELAKQKSEILALSAQLQERVEERGAELSMIEARLERGQRLEVLGRVASQVAHDVNNLLSVVLMSSWCLREEAEQLKEEERTMLEEIVAAASRTATLMHGLLDFGRTGSVEETLPAGDCLPDVASLATSVMGDAIELQVEAPDALPLVHLDRRRLEMVLLNLLLNARDAIGAVRGVVTLSAKEVEDQVVFAVEDDGPGMDDDVLGRVLEPFFTTKQRGEGTGLGLSIAADFAREVGGKLDIDSSPGHGTTVRLTIPATTEHAEPSSEPSATDPAPLRILVIEPAPVLQRLIRRVLASKGHTVVECSDLVSANHALTLGPKPVDLILVDERTLDSSTTELRGAREDAMILLGDSPGSGKHFVRKPFGARELMEAIATAAPRSRSDAAQ